MKRLTKIFGAALVLFTCTVASVAANPLDYKNALGLYGLIGPDAYGLQYQRWITNRFGIQTEGYANYNDSYVSTIGKYSFSIATQLQLKLFENPINDSSAVDFYAWALGSYKGYNDIDYVYFPTDNSSNYQDSGYLSQYSIGLGFAFDFMFWNHISIPVEFGYAGRLSKTNPWMGFTAGTGLRYRF